VAAPTRRRSNRRRRLTGSHNPNRFQPAGKSAPLLAHALPPCTAGCHENEGASVALLRRDFDGDVEGSCGRPAYLSNERRFRAAWACWFSQLLSASRFAAWWAERLAESRSVHQKKSRPGATRQTTPPYAASAALKTWLRCSTPGSRGSSGRFRFCNPISASLPRGPNLPCTPSAFVKPRRRTRHAVDAATHRFAYNIELRKIDP